jgi:hypothetical protein
MLNCKPHTTNNQDSDTIYVALHRAALAIATKLVTQRLLDATRHPDHVGLYYDPQRNLVAASLRWNTASGKIVRPLRRVGSENKFELGAPSTWPLYNLPSLLDAEPSKSVIVVEGEPCADAGNATFCDIAVFVTSAQGANNAHKTDWSPVHGREIYIWPDADDAGRQYANAVAELASKAGAKSVRILDPTAIAGREVRDGWDVVDAIRECENDAAKLAALRARLLDAMRNATEWRRVSEGQFELADDKSPFEIDCKIEPNTERVMLTVWYLGKTVLPPTRVAVLDSIRRKSALRETRQRWTKVAAEFGLAESETSKLADILERSVERKLELAAQQIAHNVASNDTDGSKHAGDAAEQLVHTIEPWSEPVELGQVLDDIVKLLSEYVVFERDSDARLVALWIALTYCFEKFDHLPLLIITSGTWRCGKSRLLSLVSWLCQRPFDVSAASVAAVFRVGEMYKPTLLLDEADNARLDDPDLAGIFNAGADREHAAVVRAEPFGDTFMPTKFNVFFPKALAGINIERYIRGSTLDRSLVIRLNRATAPYLPRATVKPIAAELARKLCRAIADSELRNDYSLLPDWLVQRDADMMLPIVSIATAAGERWQAEAIDAVKQYLGAVAEDKLHPTERLLRDIVDVCEREGVDEISAEDLARRLNEGGYDWAEKRGGRGITANWIGRSLRSVGVLPHKTNRKRLYNVKQIRDTAERYGVLNVKCSDNPPLPPLPPRAEACGLGEPTADWERFVTVEDETNRGAVAEVAEVADYGDINGERDHADTAEPLFSGVSLPQVATDWQSLEREELDAIVNQLPPELKKRYWELHSDYCVRRYPYLDARRWAWWELQRELNRHNPQGGG